MSRRVSRRDMSTGGSPTIRTMHHTRGSHISMSNPGTMSNSAAMPNTGTMPHLRTGSQPLCQVSLRKRWHVCEHGRWELYLFVQKSMGWNRLWNRWNKLLPHSLLEMFVTPCLSVGNPLSYLRGVTPCPWGVPRLHTWLGYPTRGGHVFTCVCLLTGEVTRGLWFLVLSQDFIRGRQ